MKIKEASYIISSPSVDKCPKPDKPEYAFIGRSNVGKSSLINMLCGREQLAKTSSNPGKTRLINHFLINKSWYLVDLPGYGYAKISQKQRKEWEQMIDTYLRQRENLVNLFVLIDSRHPPQKIDLAFIAKLGNLQIPFAIVFTKTDKEKPGVVKRNVEAFKTALSENWEFLPAFFITSAEKREGRDELLQYIEHLNNEFSGSRAPV